MAKKQAAKCVKRKSNFLDTLPKNEIEHVQLLIKHSENAMMEARSEGLRNLFDNQVVRLEKKLAELRAK